MAIRICPECGGKCSTTRDLCIHCGFIFPKEELIKCPECEEMIKKGLKECPICGFVFEPIVTKRVEDVLNIEEPTKEETKPLDDNALEALLSTSFESNEIEEVIENNNNLLSEEKLEQNIEEETNSIDDNISDVVTCPYCSSNGFLEIGNGFYMCLTCKGKYLSVITPMVQMASITNAIENNSIINASPIEEKSVLVIPVEDLKNDESLNTEDPIIDKENDEVTNDLFDERKGLKKFNRILIQIIYLVSLCFLVIISTLMTLFYIYGSVFKYLFTAIPMMLLGLTSIASSLVILINSLKKKKRVTSKQLLFICLCLLFSFIIWVAHDFFIMCSGEHIPNYLFIVIVLSVILGTILTLVLLIRICLYSRFAQHSVNDLINKKTLLIYLVIISIITVVCSCLIFNKTFNPRMIIRDNELVDVKNNDVLNVKIPNGVTTIGDFAFEHCYNLKNITIPNSVTTIGDCAFEHCFNLKSITIPNSVTTIGFYAFYDCSNLINVTIEDGVTTIKDCAFNCCYNLKSITIPNSVTTIGNSAFYNCSRLTDIYYKGSEQQWKEIVNTDSGIPSSCTIHYLN